MTDGNPKSGLPVDLVGTLSDGCEPYFAFQALKKLDNHLDAMNSCSLGGSSGTNSTKVRPSRSCSWLGHMPTHAVERRPHPNHA